MNPNFKELQDYIAKMEEFKLPDYKELPPIPLYMEQVVSYVTESLDVLYTNSQQVLTPFMVNNYVKAKIVMPPKHKKYSRDHVGYLLSISLLKSVVSMRDIATLIELDKRFTNDKQMLYKYFKDMQDDVIKNEAHRVRARLDTLSKVSQKKSKRKSDKDKSVDEEMMSLAYVALRLYTESETTKLIADNIMSRISEAVLPKKALKESKKEKKFEKKKLVNEASKIGDNR